MITVFLGVRILNFEFGVDCGVGVGKGQDMRKKKKRIGGGESTA